MRFMWKRKRKRFEEKLNAAHWCVSRMMELYDTLHPNREIWNETAECAGRDIERCPEAIQLGRELSKMRDLLDRLGMTPSKEAYIDRLNASRKK